MSQGKLLGSYGGRRQSARFVLNMREYFRQVSIRLTVETSFVVVFFGTLSMPEPSPSVTDRFFSMPCASVINRSAAAILHVQEISGAEWRDPEGVSFAMPLRGVLSVESP